MTTSRSLTLVRHPLPTLGPNMAVKISVQFVAGGLNYSTYKQDPRGFCVTALVFEGTGDGFERYTLFDKRSGSVLIEAAPRYSGKRLFALAAQVAARVPASLPFFERGETYEALHALAFDAVPQPVLIDSLAQPAILDEQPALLEGGL